jgi:hypothetical protein
MFLNPVLVALYIVLDGNQTQGIHTPQSSLLTPLSQ